MAKKKKQIEVVVDPRVYDEDLANLAPEDRAKFSQIFAFMEEAAQEAGSDEKKFKRIVSAKLQAVGLANVRIEPIDLDSLAEEEPEIRTVLMDRLTNKVGRH